jgi:hypothetical protein
MGTRTVRKKSEAVGETTAPVPTSRGGVTTPARPLVDFSESDARVELSDQEASDLAAWRDRVEKLAEDDPEAYAEACRTGQQL